MAAFSYQVDTTGSCNTVQFTGLATDPNGGTITYAWLFLDGSAATSTEANPVHTFPPGPGAYAVQLTVTNGAGFVHSTTQTVAIPDCSGKAAADFKYRLVSATPTTGGGQCPDPGQEVDLVWELEPIGVGDNDQLDWEWIGYTGIEGVPLDTAAGVGRTPPFPRYTGTGDSDYNITGGPTGASLVATPPGGRASDKVTKTFVVPIPAPTFVVEPVGSDGVLRITDTTPQSANEYPIREWHYTFSSEYLGIEQSREVQYLGGPTYEVVQTSYGHSFTVEVPVNALTNPPSGYAPLTTWHVQVQAINSAGVCSGGTPNPETDRRAQIPFPEPLLEVELNACSYPDGRVVVQPTFRKSANVEIGGSVLDWGDGNSTPQPSTWTGPTEYTYDLVNNPASQDGATVRLEVATNGSYMDTTGLLQPISATASLDVVLRRSNTANPPTLSFTTNASSGGGFDIKNITTLGGEGGVQGVTFSFADPANNRSLVILPDATTAYTVDAGTTPPLAAEINGLRFPLDPANAGHYAPNTWTVYATAHDATNQCTTVSQTVQFPPTPDQTAPPTALFEYQVVPGTLRPGELYIILDGRPSQAYMGAVITDYSWRVLPGSVNLAGPSDTAVGGPDNEFLFYTTRKNGVNGVTVTENPRAVIELTVKDSNGQFATYQQVIDFKPPVADFAGTAQVGAITLDGVTSKSADKGTPYEADIVYTWRHVGDNNAEYTDDRPPDGTGRLFSRGYTSTFPTETWVEYELTIEDRYGKDTIIKRVPLNRPGVTIDGDILFTAEQDLLCSNQPETEGQTVDLVVSLDNPIGDGIARTEDVVYTFVVPTIDGGTRTITRTGNGSLAGLPLYNTQGPAAVYVTVTYEDKISEELLMFQRAPAECSAPVVYDYTIAIVNPTFDYVTQGNCDRRVRFNLTASGADKSQLSGPLTVVLTPANGDAKTFSGVAYNPAATPQAEVPADRDNPDYYLGPVQLKVTDANGKTATAYVSIAPKPIEAGFYFNEPVGAPINEYPLVINTTEKYAELQVRTDGLNWPNSNTQKRFWVTEAFSQPVELRYDITDPWGYQLSFYETEAKRLWSWNESGTYTFVRFNTGAAVDSGTAGVVTNFSNTGQRITWDRTTPPPQGSRITIKQTVTNQCGSSASFTRNPLVYPPPPAEPLAATFTVTLLPTTVITPNVIHHFQAKLQVTSGTYDTVTWAWPNGQPGEPASEFDTSQASWPNATAVQTGVNGPANTASFERSGKCLANADYSLEVTVKNSGTGETVKLKAIFHPVDQAPTFADTSLIEAPWRPNAFVSGIVKLDPAVYAIFNNERTATDTEQGSNLQNRFRWVDQANNPFTIAIANGFNPALDADLEALRLDGVEPLVPQSLFRVRREWNITGNHQVVHTVTDFGGSTISANFFVDFANVPAPP